MLGGGLEVSAAEPVAFGSHRKPEAVLLPYEAYERYEALARQRMHLDSALSGTQSVQVELPGPFSPEHDREVSAYVDGQIKLGLGTVGEFESAEREITRAALILLRESPVSPTYDLAIWGRENSACRMEMS